MKKIIIYTLILLSGISNIQYSAQENNANRQVNTNRAENSSKDNYYMKILTKEINRLEEFHLKIITKLKLFGEAVKNATTLKKAKSSLALKVKSDNIFEASFFAYAPRAAGRNILHYMIWYIKKRNSVKAIYPDFSKYNYFKMKWYLKPLRTAKPYYTNPYINEKKKKWIISVVAHVSKNNDKIGVIGGDIPLSLFTGKINGMRFGKKGFAFLVKGNGIILAHPNAKYIGKKNIFSFTSPENLFNTGDTDPEINKLGRLLLKKRKKGILIIKDSHSGNNYKAYFGPVIGTDWGLCIMIKQ